MACRQKRLVGGASTRVKCLIALGHRRGLEILVDLREDAHERGLAATRGGQKLLCLFERGAVDLGATLPVRLQIFGVSRELPLKQL